MKKLFLIMLLLFTALCVFAQKAEKTGENTYRITGDNYVLETTDYNGGYMQSFKVNGVEFEDQTVPKTRGNYFLKSDGNIAKVEKITLEGNKLTVDTETAIMIYDCYPDRVEITSKDYKGEANTSVGAYFILHKKANHLRLNGKLVKDYYKEEADTKRVYVRGKAGLEISGHCMFWGHNWGGLQVVDISLAKGETKTCILKPVPVTDKEANISLDRPTVSDIAIYSPKQYQVFQRYSKTEGIITFNGKINAKITDLSYRLTGKDLFDNNVKTNWKPVKSDKFGVFNHSLKCPAGGWYTLEMKYKLGGKTKTVSVRNVGIGEIIIGAGQSNSTNSGQFPVKQTSGYAVSTDGINWKIADDPQIGVHDGTGGGSLYPALGDALYKEFNVPIALAPTGWGGTNLAQWQPDADPCGGSTVKTNINLYDFFMTRVAQFGKKGFRCVIWHQGESDFGRPTDYYYENLANVIYQSRADAGWEIPWFVAKATYIPGAGLSDTVRNAQQKLADDGVVFIGPDTDTMLEEYRDYDGKGIHFAPKGLKKHGEWWAELIGRYIHSQID